MTPNQHSPLPPTPLEPVEPRPSLRTATDILAAIPFMIGYHPTESVVVISVRDKRVLCTARIDLPPLNEPDSVVHKVADYLIESIMPQDPGGVLIVGYGPARPVERLVVPLHDCFEEAGVRVVEALRVQRGRYWPILCGDPLCCPSEGTPFDAETTAIAAEWTLAGRVALPDRAAYEAQLSPTAGADRRAMRQATERAQLRLLELLTTLDRPDPTPGDAHGHADTQAHVHTDADADAAMLAAGRAALAAALQRSRDGGALDDDEVAWLTLLLVNLTFRDEVWTRIVTHKEDLDLHLRLWLDVLRRADTELMPAPASLYGFAAWRDGQGGLARLAFERALAEDPGYTMARLLHHGLVHGLPPAALDELGQVPDAGPGPTPPARVRSSRAPRLNRRSSTLRARSRRA